MIMSNQGLQLDLNRYDFIDILKGEKQFFDNV